MNIIQAGFLSIYSLLWLCSVFSPEFKRGENKPLSQLLGSFGEHASVYCCTGSISPESSVKKSGLDPGGTGGSVRRTLQCRWIKGIVIHRRGRGEEKNPQKRVRGMGGWEGQGAGGGSPAEGRDRWCLRLIVGRARGSWMIVKMVRRTEMWKKAHKDQEE